MARTGSLTGALLAAGTLLSTSAQAYAVHVVAPGETLSGIAAANGMQVARLAAANGLAWNAVVIAGQNLQVPPADGLYTSTNGQTMGYATSSSAVARTSAASTGATSSGSTSTQSAVYHPTSTSSSSASSTYVRPGDTLGAIAARLGVSIAALAAENGISNPNYVVAGSMIRHGAGTGVATVNASYTTPTTSSTGPEGSAAYTGRGAGTTTERLSGPTIGSIASGQGVTPGLVKAVAWQESGWNNALTSSTGAQGIMQVMPGTWDWINQSLARPPLQSYSAAENVRGGTLLLKQLLRDTGGNESMAIAGYYQGLASVRQRGMYDDTKAYVNSVLAIKSRLGG